LPEVVELNDAEYSWQVFLLLEGFPDGMGGWDFLQVLGAPVMELDDALVDDLLKWRNMKDIAYKEHQRIEQEKQESEDAENVDG
jgi:hypothetical protein